MEIKGCMLGHIIDSHVCFQHRACISCALSGPRLVLSPTTDEKETTRLYVTGRYITQKVLDMLR